LGRWGYGFQNVDLDSVTVNLTGVSATGETGYTRWDETVYLGGWGRSTWGSGAWNNNLIPQAVGAVGSVAVEAEALVNVTGVQGTTTLGNIAVTGDADSINVLGNAATGELGTATVDAAAIVAVTGIEATGETGEARVIETTGVDVTGVQGTTALGTVSVTADAIVTETGLQATSALGSVTVDLVQAVDVTGVQGTTALGETTETADANIYAIGVQATGQVGTVLVWGEIVPNQNAGWVDVDDSQTPNWTEIAA
jgi:hypothetical protein